MLVIGILRAVLSQSYISVFVFLLVKIIIRVELYQQLVRSVTYTYFRFFFYKSYNAEAVMLGAHMLAAVLDQLYIPVFAFLLVKIITQGQPY